VDGRKSTYRGSVKQLPDRKKFFIYLRHGEIEMLLHSWHVSETNIHKLDVVLLDVLQRL
jgi:hypothetical protein